MNMKLYAGLLSLTILSAIGGVLTLLPVPGASYPNVLGYRSLCTFAPAATLFCFLIAGTSCVIRASLVKRRAFSGGKAVVRIVPVVVMSFILLFAVASTLWFGSVKSRYPDSETHATIAER